uniref:DNA helicase Pif1-like 2B domain-containing protein n=1 Tax=Anopheles atroparvus TaxID=41427 RepID=A0AAG5DC45_ANOAO
MRVYLQQDTSASAFNKELLRIGNGHISVDASSGFISIPPSICQFTSTKDDLIRNVYPNIGQNYVNDDWLSARAILAAKNNDSYKSIDRVENDDDAVNYPVEFLNSLDLPGMPPHHLRLKVGSVIIMLRNLHAPKLCNGTRLIITQLSNNVIVARILKGTYKGAECLIPRIPMGSNDMPFHFKRVQFPVKLAFAMTINKSQGQSLEVCGINLEMPCFSHGQLYVACSRVGKPTSLYIYAPEKRTKNVVYQAALH